MLSLVGISRPCWKLRERIKAAVVYCTHPSRVKTHTRHDLSQRSFILFGLLLKAYQTNVKECWVDIETTSSYEDEAEECIFETSADGTAHDLSLGLPADHRIANHPGEVPPNEISEDDGARARTNPRTKVPSKHEVEREAALEVGFPKVSAHMISHVYVKKEICI